MSRRQSISKNFWANLKVETAAEQERRKAEGSNVLPLNWRSASRCRRTCSRRCADGGDTKLDADCRKGGGEACVAVNLTAKLNEIREERHVPQSSNGKEVHLGAASEAKRVEVSGNARFKLTRFRDISITDGVSYLVKDLIPTMGLVVVWGPPKCGKSFWMFDLTCTVAIIHHCGVAGDRPRGHTSLTGAVDAQLAVKRDDAGLIRVKVEWLKDGEEGVEIVSQLKKVELGMDLYGDPIVSCVVVADDPMARILAMPIDQIVRPAVAKLKPKAKSGLDQLRACIDEVGREAPVSNNIPAGVRGVTLAEWRDRLGKTGVINVEGNPRQEFQRIRVVLQNAKLISVWEEFVWLA